MLNIVVIEDEAAASERLVAILKEVEPECNVVAVLNSVQQSVNYFLSAVSVDLILSDVQLGDGLSFEFFNEAQVNVPVIFVTGYDKFFIQAFDYNGIDYLLKPVAPDELSKAIFKFKKLKTHFTGYKQPLQSLFTAASGRRRTRLLVKKGLEHVLVKLEDVVIFYTENKVVYLVDRFDKKYIADKTLNELELELDNNLFFRANRQYIINLNFVKGYKPYDKVKLRIDIALADLNHEIIVSQVTAPEFRRWIMEA
ncbi:MAG: LytTR family DNA-binding domain-containing protein [Ginsengibacter sp.]